MTLLALIIGFSFSMAGSRFDQRKNLEESEADAIGTEYVRADFLPADNAAKARSLLRNYLDQRISFYETRNDRRSFGRSTPRLLNLRPLCGPPSVFPPRRSRHP